MLEYLTEAVVLSKSRSGELDHRVSLYTRKFGKLVAKAKSARKITSKLSPHLEPGNIVQARLIEKNGLQVVDALKMQKLPRTLTDLGQVDALLAIGETDDAIWHELCLREFSWARFLRILGWDPNEASCERCGTPEPYAFTISEQIFHCKNCLERIAGEQQSHVKQLVHTVIYV